MTATLNLMLLLIILIGLAGTLLPTLPGTGIILAGALLHALLSDFTPLTWPYLVTLALLFLAGYGGQYLLTAVTSRKMGASGYGIIGACLGLAAGIFTPIPGGVFAGAFLGGVAFELFFARKDLLAAMASGAGALLGLLLSLFFEFTIGLGMTAIIFFQLFRPAV